MFQDAESRKLLERSTFCLTERRLDQNEAAR